jgi:hypothetical protein
VLLIWLLVAGLSLYSLRSRGVLHSLLALGGALTLYAIGFLNIVFLLVYPSWESYFEKWWVYTYFTGFFVGVTIIMILVFYGSIPRWLVTLLPVRGLHARRLLSAVALVGMLGPLLARVAPGLGANIFPPVGVLLAVFICTALYAPLWDVFARWLEAGDPASVIDNAAENRKHPQ